MSGIDSLRFSIWKNRIDPKYPSAFLICDIQEKFRPVINSESWDAMIETTQKMLQIATMLDLPIIVTEHVPSKLGHTVEEIREVLPPHARIIEKTKFSMATPEVKRILSDQNLWQCIIAGIEAHVCVRQTAMDLFGEGVNPHLLADAIYSRSPVDRQFALHNLSNSGVNVTTLETLTFDYLGSATHPAFKAATSLFRKRLTPDCAAVLPILPTDSQKKV